MSASKSPFEEQLTKIAGQFIAELLKLVQAAPLGVLADFAPKETAFRVAASAPAPLRKASAKKPMPAAPSSPAKPKAPSRISRERQEQLADEILDELEVQSVHGLYVTRRALASALNVPADLLMVPLRRLRASGDIVMHGDRQSATYSLAETPPSTATQPPAAPAPDHA